MEVKQFIPQETCLKCDGCCRFSRKDTPWAPHKRELRAYHDHFICSCFSLAAQRCRDYENRLLDCRIYPFLLHRNNGNIYLAADLNCPYLSKNVDTEEFKNYADYLRNFLNSPEAKVFLRENESLICEYDEPLKIISEISLDGEILGAPLNAEDRPLFEGYLGKALHKLSSFSFANIYVWRSLFDIRYKIIKGSLCVFFKDKAGCFMYLPPLGIGSDNEIINECFRIMDSENTNCIISRIENIQENDLDFYRRNGFKIIPKDKEYVYLREDLAGLSGGKFKSQRAAYNYFIKNYKHSYEPLTINCSRECLSVLADWRQERLSKKEAGPSPAEAVYYCGILDDNCLAQEEALLNFSRLNLLGRVVKIEGRARAYTFGFELNREVFCVMAETADLKFKGIAQFLFREFCRDLEKYKYINVMDDSGLANIKAVKLSYRPYLELTPYIAERP